MTPNRKAANKIIQILTAAREIKDPETRYKFAEIELLDLASQLIPHLENYGHAGRIHKLSGGSDNGNN